MFVLFSINSDPWKGVTRPMSRFGLYLLASVLLVIQLVFMAALAIGVPATTGFLAAVTRNQLSPVLSAMELGKEGDEVVAYLVLDTILLTLLIWGAIPALAASRVSSSRGKMLIYVVFGGAAAVLATSSIRTTYLAWNWARMIELTDGDAALVERCKLIYLTVGILFCMGAAFVMACSCYASTLGTPPVVRQMLDDAARLLVLVRVLSGTAAVGNVDAERSKDVGVESEVESRLDVRARG